jgi:hypothetical protein
MCFYFLFFFIFFILFLFYFIFYAKKMFGLCDFIFSTCCSLCYFIFEQYDFVDCDC